MILGTGDTKQQIKDATSENGIHGPYKVQYTSFEGGSTYTGTVEVYSEGTNTFYQSRIYECPTIETLPIQPAYNVKPLDTGHMVFFWIDEVGSVKTDGIELRFGLHNYRLTTAKNNHNSYQKVKS